MGLAMEKGERYGLRLLDALGTEGAAGWRASAEDCSWEGDFLRLRSLELGPKKELERDCPVVPGKDGGRVRLSCGCLRGEAGGFEAPMDPNRVECEGCSILEEEGWGR